MEAISLLNEIKNKEYYSQEKIDILNDKILNIDNLNKNLLDTNQNLISTKEKLEIKLNQISEKENKEKSSTITVNYTISQEKVEIISNLERKNKLEKEFIKNLTVDNSEKIIINGKNKYLKKILNLKR